MLVPFWKYEGAGNDFILVDNRNGDFRTDQPLVARLCDRHLGIGADGLMTLAGSVAAECSMRYFNADGSEGEMCGNGARCFALFMEHLSIGGTVKCFDALDGVHTARLLTAQAGRGEVELGMINVTHLTEGDGWWFLNTGVPHYVEFVDAAAETDVAGRGRAIRGDRERFPDGTNVDFVEAAGTGWLRMRTYERGVERETLACGTGAVAAAIVANHALQHDVSTFRIDMPGGELGVRFRRESGTGRYVDILLTGPARRIYQGEFDTENF